MDPIKDAFSKVREDMDRIEKNMLDLKSDITLDSAKMTSFSNEISKLKESHKTSLEIIYSQLALLTQNVNSISINLRALLENLSTQTLSNKTQSLTNKTQEYPYEPLKHQNLGSSTGNEGVSTDRQTHRQTHRQTQNTYQLDPIKGAAHILDSLDSLKKEIRIKFKKLTTQEMTVFSAIYQLEEEQGFADYKTLSERLNLTQSSIRDYIGRIINKGILVDKIKINNKTIHLKIPSDLKRVATLSTITQLRDL